MKVKLWWKRVNEDEQVDETYEWDDVRDEESAQDKAQRLFDRFNATLRPHETARVLVKVELLDGSRYARKEHQWDKVSLVTEAGPEGLHDRMRCKVCGITGKRIELGSPPRRDPQYSKEVFARCDTAIAEVKKKEIRAKRIARAKDERLERKRRLGRGK